MKSKFGVELEFIAPGKLEKDTLKRGFEDIGEHLIFDESTTRDYYNEGWKCTMDSSIGAPYFGQYYDDDYHAYPDYWGLEFVSPILKYNDPEHLKRLEQVYKLLRSKFKMESVPQAGMHIHTEYSSRDRLHLLNTLKIMSILEVHLIGTQRYGGERLNDRHCTPIFQRDLKWIWALPSSMVEFNDTPIIPLYCKSNTEDMTFKYHNSRYRGLNLHSIIYRGTLEYRYFSTPSTWNELFNYLQLVEFITNMNTFEQSIFLLLLRRMFNYLNRKVSISDEEFTKRFIVGLENCIHLVFGKYIPGHQIGVGTLNTMHVRMQPVYKALQEVDGDQFEDRFSISHVDISYEEITRQRMADLDKIPVEFDNAIKILKREFKRVSDFVFYDTNVKNQSIIVEEPAGINPRNCAIQYTDIEDGSVHYTPLIQDDAIRPVYQSIISNSPTDDIIR